jgi:hypothetical protein
MPEPADPYRARRSILPVLLLLIAALLIGMAGMAWLVHRYDNVADIIKPTPPAPIVAPAPQRSTPLVNIIPAAAPELVEDIVDQRIQQIEDKVEDINQRAASATNDAHRAEALLVAFAARRAIDQGAPLGYLETLLRERFGRSEPRAVATVISASRRPVTIEKLREQLDQIEPQLSVFSTEDNWLDGFRRELADLIVIRRASAPSIEPVDRFDRARDDLASGHVDAALVEIARLPGRKAAEGWIAEARRYVQARAALDRIESAALLAPGRAPVAVPVAPVKP